MDNSRSNAVGKQWQGRTDGAGWMHSALSVIMRYAPLRAMYLFADVFVVPFYLAFSKSSIPIYHYFRKIRGNGIAKSSLGTCRTFSQFSKNVLDKFRMYAGGTFSFEVDNMELYDTLSRSDTGFLIFSAHIGNYELAGYTFKASDKRYNALLFADEAETIMKYRDKMFRGNNIRMIPVSPDMSHLIVMSNALADGESVSIPADRVLEGQRTFSVEFLGHEAEFPAGPFLLAAKRNLSVLSIQVMKDSAKKYKVFIKKLDGEGTSAHELAQSLLKSYTSHLESVLDLYPHQWFNFYEFWKS